MTYRRRIGWALLLAILAQSGVSAAAGTEGPEHATTSTTASEIVTTAAEATEETPTTGSVRHVVRIPEGMEQRWARLEAAGRAAGLNDEELARLLDLESKLFLARSAGDADAERRAVAERRALLTPARWRALRDELRRQTVPDAAVSDGTAATTASATGPADSATTAP